MKALHVKTCGTTAILLRRNSMALNTFTRKQERYQIKKLRFQKKKLGKESDLKGTEWNKGGTSATWTIKKINPKWKD